MKPSLSTFLLVSMRAGFFLNLRSRYSKVWSSSLLNMKKHIPRVNMFLHLTMAFRSRPLSLRLSLVRVVMGETMILRSPIPSSSIGFMVLKPAF